MKNKTASEIIRSLPSVPSVPAIKIPNKLSEKFHHNSVLTNEELIRKNWLEKSRKEEWGELSKFSAYQIRWAFGEMGIDPRDASVFAIISARILIKRKLKAYLRAA